LIRVISICVFRDGDRILVCEGIDAVNQQHYARPLGGGIERGETSQQALVREIREELAQEMTDVRLLGVLENIFECDGAAGHEIVFVYDGKFQDETMYDLAELPMNEPGWRWPPRWQSLDFFGPTCRLVPDGLSALLQDSTKL
jgi:ADP-ribose pyrophosphatase YjhB (NUDIX family)